MNREIDLQFKKIVGGYVEKNSRFLPRPWLANEIDNRLALSDKKFVLLTAEPGMGKSTFMAQLAYDNDKWLRYFIRRDQVSGLSSVGARLFLMRLGFQLEHNYPDLIDKKNKNIESKEVIGQAEQGSEILGISVESLKVSPFYQQILIKVSQTVKESNGQMTGIQIDKLIADPLLLPLKDLQEIALFKPARTLAEEDEQLVILIDALDELRYARSKDDILEWLIGINPDDLPDNIRFVLSSRPPNDRLEQFMKNQGAGVAHLKLDHQKGENKGLFQEQLDKDTGEYVEKLLNDERLKLDQYWSTERTAEAWAETAVDKAEGNLGYMDMIARALDHAIDQGATKRVRKLLDMANLPDELAGLYTFFLNQIKVATMRERIERKDKSGGTFFVNAWTAVYRRLLGVMTVAFEPLEEAQWHILSNVQSDIEVTQQAIGELKPFLDFDEENDRYRFYHSTLPEYLGDKLLEKSRDTAGIYAPTERWHQRIGRYYYQQSDDHWLACDNYGLRHLPGHLSEGALPQELDALLMDFDWLQVKLNKINILELLDDYNFLGAKKPNAPVILVQKALRLSAHVLAVDAAQLPPQLIGRLQGFEEPELQTLVVDAAQRQSGKWMRPLHTTLTPPGNALLRTLTGHTGAVNDVAAIPDDTKRYIISASDDKTLKVWDLHEEVEAQKTLRGHKDKVTAVAVTPDGKQAVSFSDDKTIKVWNLDDELETESASYDIETTLIKPMVVTCEGKIVGTTQDDEGSQFVRMWQLPGDFEPCENSTNVKETSFAKRFAKGFGSIAIRAFVISILFFWVVDQLPLSIDNLGFFGFVFSISFFIVGYYGRLIFWEPNEIKIVNLPIKTQATNAKNSDNNSKKMNRSRKKIGGETAKRAKDVVLRLVWTMAILSVIFASVFLLFGIISADALIFFYLSLVAIFFFIFLGLVVWYAVKVIYSDENIDAIAIWLKGKKVVAVARNHTVKARDLHKRGWRTLLHGRLTFKFSGRLKPITAMAITSDRKYMVHASDNSLATRQLKSDVRNRITSRVYLKQLSRHEGPISALVTLPDDDNKHVVSASHNALKLWNLKKGSGFVRIGGVRQVNTLLVAPNGAKTPTPWIISAANDGTLKVWDIADAIKDEEGGNRTDSNQLKTLSMVADGSQVITISDSDRPQRSHNHNVRTWNISDVIKDRAEFLEFDIGRLDRVAVAPGGKQAVSVRGKHLLLWDLQEGKNFNKVRLNHPMRWKRLPNLVKVLVNKSTVVLIRIYLIDFITLFFLDLLFITFLVGAGALLVFLRGGLAAPVAWVLDKVNQRHAARNDRSKSLRRSRASESKAIREQLSAIISVRVGAFVVTPNGRFAASAVYKDVIVTNLEEKRQIVLRGHTDEVTAVAVTPDGQHIVSAAQDKAVRVWQLNQDNGQPNMIPVDREAKAVAAIVVAIASNGQQIVFATNDHKLYVWSPESKSATLLTEKEGEITAVTFIHNDQAVIVACRDRTVEVWCLATEQRVATYTGDATPLHLSYTVNNNTIAVGDENGKIQLLQLEGID